MGLTVVKVDVKLMINRKETFLLLASLVKVNGILVMSEYIVFFLTKK